MDEKLNDATGKIISLGLPEHEVVQMVYNIVDMYGHVDLRDHFSEMINDKERDRLVSLIVSDSRYMLDKAPETQRWIIRKNPLYKKSKWHEEHYFIDKLLWAIVPAILTLIVALFIARYNDKLKSQSINDLNKRLDSLSKEQFKVQVKKVDSPVMIKIANSSKTDK